MKTKRCWGCLAHTVCRHGHLWDVYITSRLRPVSHKGRRSETKTGGRSTACKLYANKWESLCTRCMTKERGSQGIWKSCRSTARRTLRDESFRGFETKQSRPPCILRACEELLVSVFFLSCYTPDTRNPQIPPSSCHFISPSLPVSVRFSVCYSLFPCFSASIVEKKTFVMDLWDRVAL